MQENDTQDNHSARLSTTIHLVRHGLVHDPDLIIYGRLPRYRLHPEGRRQAQAAAGALGQLPITHVFASPLLRARQTADILIQALSAARLHVSRLLMEVRTPYEGQPRHLAEARRWDIYTGAGPGYEQPDHVLARGLKFVSQVRRRYPGQQVVAVSHGDVIGFLALWAHGIPVAAAYKERYFPEPASITSLTFDVERPGAPPTYQYLRPY